MRLYKTLIINYLIFWVRKSGLMKNFKKIRKGLAGGTLLTLLSITLSAPKFDF